MAKVTKVWYAIEAYDFGAGTGYQHLAPMITEYPKDGYKMVEAKEVKAKQVTMPNGRKAKLFEVNGKIWARYKDGSACPDYKA